MVRVSRRAFLKGLTGAGICALGGGALWVDWRSIADGTAAVPPPSLPAHTREALYYTGLDGGLYLLGAGLSNNNVNKIQEGGDILKLMVEKYKSLGGELRMGAGVQAIDHKNGKLQSLQLENGETLVADKVLSSAGIVETLRLCRPGVAEESDLEIGRMSFMESIFVLDRPPKAIGYDKSIVFYSTESRFQYRVPEGLTDVTSGVLCCPNNFQSHGITWLQHHRHP